MSDTARDEVLKVFDFYVEVAPKTEPEHIKETAEIYRNMCDLLTAEERMWLSVAVTFARTGEKVEEYKHICAVIRQNLSDRVALL